VVAGAGTGKTRVTVHRLVHLIRGGIAPDRLLAVTFTNRAAVELRDRVAALTGSSGEKVNVGTFHWLGHRILRRYASQLDVGPGFQLLSPRESLMVARSIAADDAELAGGSLATLRDFISAARNRRLRDGVGAEHVHEIAARYVAELRRRHALDLDDLILESVDLLRRDSTVRQRLQRHFAHILVDEYQDTNHPQVELLSLLVGRSGQVTAVGDDDQAIYGWRYASGNMLAFVDTFPNTRIVRLELNYRSTQRILNPANELLRRGRNRIDKTLTSTRKAGYKPTMFAAGDESEEAIFVAAGIRRLLARGIRGEEVAVLYRINVQSRAIEDALIQSGIRYRVRSGLRFFERPEVARVIDALRVVESPADREAWARLLRYVPGLGRVRSASVASAMSTVADLLTPEIPAGIPAATIRSLSALAAGLARVSNSRSLHDTVVGVSDLLDSVIGRAYASGQDEQAVEANLAEFISLAARFGVETRHPDVIGAFLDRLSLSAAPSDHADSSSAAVQLMTIHSAKGLEFAAVFVVGIEEGLLPHRRSLASNADIEEERRLLYVAMTRAKDHLYLSYARTRQLSGSQAATGPSRFLEEMPSSFFLLSQSPDLPRRDRLASVQLGERVSHARWGAGEVVGSDGLAPRVMITIKFDSGESRRIQLRHAPLKHLS